MFIGLILDFMLIYIFIMKNNTFTHVIKRDGAVVPFTSLRITNAIYRAAIASGGRDMETARKLTKQVIKHLNKTLDSSRNPTIEQIQDAIEKVLIDNGHALTAKAFILFRNDRAQDRKQREELGDSSKESDIAWQKVWESLNWSINHDTVSIADLNRRIEDGTFPSLVKESEENYLLDIIKAADTIIKRGDEVKIVIIAGPSSSGKTTTTLKIAEYLKDEGFEFIPYHVDNYFFNLELHPVDERGDYDYETPEAIDIKLLNSHLQKLLEGKSVKPPYFNFKTGKREGTTAPVKLKKGQILLIDSLHGLYEPMTAGISKKSKIKLYTEPILQMRGIDGSYIRWTDIRLIRRIVRDKRTRGKDPLETLKHWHYVRRSELMYITPYAQSADHIINSSLPYELPVWKNIIGGLFKEWAENKDGLLKNDKQTLNRSRRVNNILNNIKPWDDLSVIPKDALLREFIGDSSYKY